MKFDFTPDPKVLLALTHTPMQPLDALCELIDNAIDSFNIAKIQGVPVDSPLIIIELPTRKQLAENSGVLRIQDNGPGMTAEDAEKAIKAGFSGNNPYDSLGLFGMGFNISTGKLGNRTTFMTARADSGNYIKTVIDLEKINKTKSYSLQADELSKGDCVFHAQDSHGTIIEVSDWWPIGNANNGFVEKLIRYGMPTVRREIGRRYASILREGIVKIIINDEKCVPFEHCVWDEKRFVTRKSGNIPAKIYIDHVVGTSKRCGKCTAILSSGETECPACGSTVIRTIDERVSGWLGIQRFDSVTEFGVDLIRNGRAIRKAEKQAFFEFTDELGNVIKDYPIDSQFGRIVGEIHLNHVPVDFLKTDFQRSSAEWQRAMLYLRGGSSLQPQQPGADKNVSPMFKLYQGYRRVRNFGKGDLYMGYWDADARKACRISRDTEEDYYKKFLDKLPGYFDDSEWWKLVESADQPPVADLIECPECGGQNLKEADHCIACGAVLKGKECVNPECKQIIPLSAKSCPHCGANQVPVVIEPWICEVCHKKNIADDSTCKCCGSPRGTKDPLSLEVMIDSADKVDSLSDSSFMVTLADGTKNNPLTFEVYSTHSPIINPLTKEELPIRIFKNIGKLVIFVNKHHPIFTKCGISPEQLIASEIAMYLYDERQNLANYAEHNLSNLTWAVIQKEWLTSLEISADVVLKKAIDLLDAIRVHIADKLGSDAAYFFDDLTPDQKKSLTDTLIKKNIDLAQIGNLKATGKYILYAPFDFLLNLYSASTESFFNGGIWSTSLSNGEDGLLDPEIVEHINNKIKQQYRNSMEDVVNYARDKYDDDLTLRRVQLSIEFLQKKLVE